jgi:hypothetical protein
MGIGEGPWQQPRPKLVLGRRNWLFVWEDLGGERTARIVGTCVAHGIKPAQVEDARHRVLAT